MHPIALPKRFIHNRIYFAIFGLLAVDLASIGTTGPHFFRGVTLTLVLLSVDVWIRRRKSDLREQTHELMLSLGLKVSIKSYGGLGHGADNKVISDLADFIAEHIPPL